MKTTLYRRLFVGISLVLFCSFLKAQESQIEASNLAVLMMSSGSDNSLLANDGLSNMPNLDVSGIQIEQMGAHNQVKAGMGNKADRITINQIGSSNTALLDFKSLRMDEKLVQKGDHNFFKEYANGKNLNLERNINQIGNRQNVVIYGSNSLTKNLKVNLQGNATGVTIRNFN